MINNEQNRDAGADGVSRRRFLRWGLGGGLALAGGWALWRMSEPPQGPVYPGACADSAGKLPGFTGEPPNVVLINMDDLGFGDPGCYGSQALHTPNMDALASQGVRFVDFHACDAVCTPSRAGLLTGRYPARMMLDTPLHPGRYSLKKRAVIRLGYACGKIGLMDLATRDAAHGIAACELTLPEALKARGYRTGMIGKWHLGDFGHDPAYNPVKHGFDDFFGVPYSNDMRPFPLYHNLEKLDAEIQDQAALTGRYTEHAVKFINQNRGRRFFLYLAHTFPHRPLHASEKFRGKSAGGLYGDVVEELDWSVGQVLEALESNGLADNTVVMLTSDNGPWYQGSPGGFRGRKGQSFEGGHRVPFIVRWPGNARAGAVCSEPAMNIDLFPTILAAAGLAPPDDRIIDGRDITSLITDPDAKSPHDYLYFYHHGDLEGVRSGKWKYFRNVSHYIWPMPNNKILGVMANHTTGPLPLLYDLDMDPGEAYNLADKYPEVAKRMDAAMTRWEKSLEQNRVGFVKK